jgi:hypothetical protein
MSEVFRVVMSRPGVVVVTDGSVLALRIVIVGVKNVGFSPFGGVNFAVKTAGGVATLFVPDELKEQVKNKPLSPPDRPPEDGWDLVEVERQEPAEEEVEVLVDDKSYRVSVTGEATMVSRNMNYRTEFGEPLYWVQWSVKVKWRST